MTKRVFGYVRCSSQEQMKHDGPDRQAAAIESLCKANGLSLECSFLEPISGTVEGLDRPKLAELFQRVDSRAGTAAEITAIVVENLGRLARDLMVSELLLAECRKRKLKVFASDHGLVDMAEDSGDPSRTLIRQIFGALHQWDKTMTVLKLKSARDRIRARGERCEGVRPYGAFTGEQEVINSVQAFFQGETQPTYREVANFLNSTGTKTRKGLLWSKETVKKVLGQHLKKI